LSSVQQAGRVADEKKEERKKESLVKYKSADNCVWWPKERRRRKKEFVVKYKSVDVYVGQPK